MPRVINYEGRKITVPDDFSDEEVSQVLAGGSAPAPAQPTAPVAQSPNLPALDQNDLTMPQPFRDTVGWQGAGRGIAETAFFLPDLAAMGMRAASEGLDWGSQKLGGPELNIYEPKMMPSEAAATLAGQGAEALGFPVVDPEKMRGDERFAYEANRFGTQAGLGSGALIKAAEKNVLPVLSRPYREAGGSTVAGDTAAGVGAGIGNAGYDQYASDYVKKIPYVGPTLDPIARMFTMLLGGVAGAGVKQGVESGARGAFKVGKKLTGRDNVYELGRDPETGDYVKESDADYAAKLLQGSASNPAVAAKNIEENVTDLVPYSTVLPSTGLLSDDVGLTGFENTMRQKDPVPFIQRDQQVNTNARDVVDMLAPRGSTGRDFTDTAEATQAGREAEAATNLAYTQAGAQQQAQELGQQGAALAARQGTGEAAGLRLDQNVEDTLMPMQQRQQELYNSVDPDFTNTVNVDDLVDQAETVRAGLGQLNTPDRVIPRGLLARIERTAPVDEEGARQLGAEVSVGEMRAVLPEIDATIARAEKAQNYNLARNLRTLRDSMKTHIANSGGEDAARFQEAEAFHGDVVGPTFGRGPGDAAAKFRKDFNLSRPNEELGIEGRTSTPPSQTAGKFLQKGQPEKAQSLRRFIDQSPNPQAAERNARDYLLADLADSGAVDAQGRLNANAVRRWANQWGGALDVAPGLRQEVTNLATGAEMGGQNLQRLEGEVGAAQQNFRNVQQDAGAFQSVVGKSPENAVKAIFGHGDPEAEMGRVVAALGNNERAKNGLKAAVRDYLVENKTMNAPQKTTTGKNPVSFAKLDDVMQRNERVLAQVYTPEEMASIQGVHRLLRRFKDRELQATTGSASAERLKGSNGEMLDTVELLLKAKFGVLKGGGMFRTWKLGLKRMGFGLAEPKEVSSLVGRFFFDPKVAQHLLTRNVPGDEKKWVMRLNTLLGLTEAGREVTTGE